MKSETTQHIFYVHSNITLLAALATTQHLGITQATFLYGRGFKSDFIKVPFEEAYLSPKIDALTAIPTSGSSFLTILYLKTLKEIDTLLKTVGKGNFTLYLPNTKNYLMQFLITNKGCQSFNILEEGLVIFMGINQIVKKTNPYYIRSFWGRIKKNIKFYDHASRSQYYNSAYVYLDKIYLFFDPQNYAEIDKSKITLLKWPILSIHLPDYSNTNIFVFDNTVGEKITDLSTNLKIVNLIFQKLKGEKFLIKFHPAQQDTQEIIQVLDTLEIHYDLLDYSVPLELIFLQSSNINVYGLLSSLLFYAAAAGQHSYSFIRCAEKEDNNITNWTSLNMPEVFFESVTLL